MLHLSDRLISAEGKSEWRAHWRVVFASIVGIMIAQTHIYSLGVMIGPLEQEFGWGRAQINSGLLIMSMVVFPLAPVMGVAIDRFGPRRIALTGITLYASGVAFLSVAQQPIWTWWALWTFLASASLFIKPTVWIAAVTSLFSASRGLSLAVTLCSTGIASSFVPLLTVFLLEDFGWRTTYLMLGGMAAVAGIPILFMFFSSAKDKARRPTVPSAGLGAPAAANIPARKSWWDPALRHDLTSSHFIRLVAATLIISIVSMALIINLVPILRSNGMSLTTAAAIGGIVGITQIIGRLSAGLLLDHFDARRIGALSFCFPMLSWAILIVGGGSVPFAILATIIFGLSIGAEMDVIAYLAARFFGTRNFGAIFGVIVGVLALGNGLGPVLGGLVYDLTGTYDLALWGLIPMTLFSGYLILTLGDYPDPEQEGVKTLEGAAPAST